MITPKNIIRHELIGLQAKIVSSSNPVVIGIEGKVVEESRNTLTLETMLGTKTAIKEQCVFSFKLPSDKRVKVDGKLLVGRPEDRIKKKLKEW